MAKITERSDIRKIIEESNAVKNIDKKMGVALSDWWTNEKQVVESFPKNNHLHKFRRDALKSLKDKLVSFGVLDNFQVAGIFVNWWENLKYDFKTIVAIGWSPSLISDERIKKSFFAKEIKEIEKLENKSAKFDGELNELFEEIEEWDEEEDGKKTIGKIKAYLKKTIKGIGESNSESAKTEKEKFQKLSDVIVEKEKELKAANKDIKNSQKELDKKVEEKRQSFTEEEAKALILEKLFDAVFGEMERYLSVEKKVVVGIFEHLWDKYKVNLEVITTERDKETKKLNSFLQSLGYFK